MKIKLLKLSSPNHCEHRSSIKGQMIKLCLLLLLASCSAKNQQEDLFTTSMQKLSKDQELTQNGRFFKSYYESIEHWKDKDGNEVRQYSRSARIPQWKLYIPFVSFFFDRSYDNFEIIATFDKAGNVIDTQNFYNKARINSSAFCDDEIGSCIKKIELKH